VKNSLQGLRNPDLLSRIRSPSEESQDFAQEIARIERHIYQRLECSQMLKKRSLIYPSANPKSRLSKKICRALSPVNPTTRFLPILNVKFPDGVMERPCWKKSHREVKNRKAPIMGHSSLTIFGAFEGRGVRNDERRIETKTVNAIVIAAGTRSAGVASDVMS
jgi:hypothetical protein